MQELELELGEMKSVLQEQISELSSKHYRSIETQTEHTTRTIETQTRIKRVEQEIQTNEVVMDGQPSYIESPKQKEVPVQDSYSLK